MLTDDEVAELAALRARAYGAKADLSDDPAGLARLTELEDKARGVVDASTDAAAPVDEIGPMDAVASDGVPADDLADDVTAPSADAGADARPAGPSTRATWPRRVVLGIGIPSLVAAGVLGAGIAAGAGAGQASAWPFPHTTLSPVYAVSLADVRRGRSWDGGSPVLLADIGGTLVWGGTTANGTMTCISVREVSQSSSACGATADLTESGIGLSVHDPSTGELRTFIARLNGMPLVTSSTDATGGHLFDCPECGALVPNPSVTISPEPTTGGEGGERPRR